MHPIEIYRPQTRTTLHRQVAPHPIPIISSVKANAATQNISSLYFFFIPLSLIFIPFIHNRIMLSHFFFLFKSRDRQTAQLVVHRLQSNAVQTVALAESHLLFGVESRMRAQELHSGVGLQMEK